MAEYVGTRIHAPCVYYRCENHIMLISNHSRIKLELGYEIPNYLDVKQHAAKYTRQKLRENLLKSVGRTKTTL